MCAQLRTLDTFRRGAIVTGTCFGDEGKGKFVDSLANDFKSLGHKLLGVRSQGGGNAGHTVKTMQDGELKSYFFHYLPSSSLAADTVLLGAGMLLDPIRLLKENETIPSSMRPIVLTDERACISTEIDRAMDSWCENARLRSGQEKIGTTKSGIGPGAGNRGYRFHVTFADALNCKSAAELKAMFNLNPLLPDSVRAVATDEYINELWDALHQLTTVNSSTLYAKCRRQGFWSLLLETSQAPGLDPLFGNGGHYTTSTPCTDIGSAYCAGLTMNDFPDGSYIICKAYTSKVGSGPFITKFTQDEQKIADYIYDMVGETGVTTGRKRDLGWFDGPAVRHAISLSSNPIVCMNCMDVIAKLAAVTDEIKVCYAYRHKESGRLEYDWPYFLDQYEPMYKVLSIKEMGAGQLYKEFIDLVEDVLQYPVSYYGVGPESNSIIANRKRRF